MAVDVASPALVRAGKEADKEIPGCAFSGVLGDKAHTYGYHRGRNVLPHTDYSVELPLDRLGNAKYASALDLSFTPAQMKIVTARLRKSALDPNDPRLECLREFYGTLNGRTVFGLIKNGQMSPWSGSTSDKSHLWHVHLSFFRKFANDYRAIRGVVDVMKGVPYKSVVPIKPAPVVPTKPIVVVPVTTHKVVKGDTLVAIAKRYSVDIDELRTLNNVPPSNVIRVGKILKLPILPEEEEMAFSARDFWATTYTRYFTKKGDTERKQIAMVDAILQMDAAIARIEAKLSDTEEEVTDVDPPA